MSLLSKNARNLRKKASKFSAARFVCFSFIVFILIGCFLFYFFEDHLNFIDSLFLATSAICLTGLTPINISTLSFSSKIILLVLIQLGGLAIVMVGTILGLLVILKISRNIRIQELMSTVIDPTDTNYNIKKEFSAYFRRIIRSILQITLFIESIGTVAIYFSLPTDASYSTESKFFFSLFTSISSFNNAGFSLTDNLFIFRYSSVTLSIIAALVVTGGIGFPVILFIEKYFLKFINHWANQLEVITENYVMESSLKNRRKNFFRNFYIKFLLPKILKIPYILSHKIEDGVIHYIQDLKGEANQIQTKIIIYTSLFLILLGSFCIFLIEQNNPKTIGTFALIDKMMNSFFLSISTRTAGFNTFDITHLRESSYLLICYLMTVGGGPQGTAGGLKVTAFVIVVFYVKNILSPNNLVEIQGKKISKNSVAVAIRTVFIFITFLAIILFLMLVLNPEQNLKNIIFEVVSAFSNVGLSMGLIPSSNSLSKIIYILLMYFGRIGIFLIVIAITGISMEKYNQKKDEDGYKIQI